MTAPEVLILAVQIIGFAGAGFVIYRMGQQVRTLNGTIQTMRELNQTALEMARAFDPKKYADAVNVYQELAEKNAKATVEEARREFQREQQQTAEQANRALQQLMNEYKDALTAGFKLLQYVPPARRHDAITATELPQDTRQHFLDLVPVAPDLSYVPPKKLTLEAILAGKVTVVEPLMSFPKPAPPPPPPPPTPTQK